jgi:hypothetical protein
VIKRINVMRAIEDRVNEPLKGFGVRILFKEATATGWYSGAIVDGEGRLLSTWYSGSSSGQDSLISGHANLSSAKFVLAEFLLDDAWAQELIREHSYEVPEPVEEGEEPVWWFRHDSCDVFVTSKQPHSGSVRGVIRSIKDPDQDPPIATFSVDNWDPGRDLFAWAFSFERSSSMHGRLKDSIQNRWRNELVSYKHHHSAHSCTVRFAEAVNKLPGIMAVYAARYLVGWDSPKESVRVGVLIGEGHETHQDVIRLYHKARSESPGYDLHVNLDVYSEDAEATLAKMPGMMKL